MQPKTITYKGEPFQLPFIVHHATSVNLYSLFDYEAASRLCEQQNFKPIIIRTGKGKKKAAGFIAAIDYQQTSAVPYLEWSLGVFVISNNIETPEIDFINETSLFFQNIMDEARVGNSIFCPVLVLSESLPTDIGVDLYGLPKELGVVTYEYNDQVSNFAVSTKQDSWIMKATFPTKRSISAKFGLLWSLYKAYGFRPPLQAVRKKEFSVTLLGSAKILAKKARMNIKIDPHTEMFTWDKKDCQFKTNEESSWGKTLLDLQVQPKLVCHVPHLQFKFSEPLEQG